jgi:enoyl-CoA hydratase/carnithine racemase
MDARLRLAPLLLAALLQGCVTDTQFIAAGGVTDPDQLHHDMNACRDFSSPLIGALAGAAMGGSMGAVGGAEYGTSGRDAAAGALLGGAVGLLTGLLFMSSGKIYERCMEQKGYHPA